MKTIGITGGVGSGKTAVLGYLKEKYGARVIVADEAAHLLEEPGQPCYNRLVREFGAAILEGEKEGAALAKEKLAALIFQSEDARRKVNDIIHPEVKKYILAKIARERELGTEYVIVEAALLLECGYLELLDEIWYVYASEEKRRERLKSSRGYSDEKIGRIMASQMEEAGYRMKCRRVIDNDGDFKVAAGQIDAYLDEIIGNIGIQTEAD